MPWWSPHPWSVITSPWTQPITGPTKAALITRWGARLTVALNGSTARAGEGLREAKAQPLHRNPTIPLFPCPKLENRYELAFYSQHHYRRFSGHGPVHRRPRFGRQAWSSVDGLRNSGGRAR